MKRLLSFAPFVVAVALPFFQVQACGPDFAPDVFVHSIHPDNPKAYAAGKLGVLLPTYPRTELTVAFRYLNGGTLSAEEQRAYEPTLSFSEQVRRDDDSDSAQAQSAASRIQYAEPPGPADAWLVTRNQYAPPEPDLHPVTEYGMIYTSGYFLALSYENCQADAFLNAEATLKSRAKAWGAHSAQLADWIKGQDAVFSNCGVGFPQSSYPANRPVIHSSAPAAEPADAPVLLRLDRAYQMAAAQFYCGQLATARDSFRAIAQDASSPWHDIARYLVARTLVREAFLHVANGPDDVMARFDPDLLKQAGRELEAMPADHLTGISRDAVQSMLNLVRIRTEPQARLREISQALAGPKTDPGYEQDLIDLNWYLNGKLDSMPLREDSGDGSFNVTKAGSEYRQLTMEEKTPGFDKAFNDAADLRSSSPVIDWLVTFQSPSAGAKKHAIGEWKRTSKTPWLVAAIMKALPSDPEAASLIESAAHVASSSPEWATVTFHRLRLLAGAGSAADARSQLDKVLPAVKTIGSDSANNLFTGLRMRTASNLDEALADAPRKIIERTSEEQSSVDECLTVMKDPKRNYDCKKDNSPVEFSDDAASIFSKETPLAELAQTALSGSLPQHLKTSVAMMTWVRAVLLKKEAVAAQVFPLLPMKLQREAGAGVGFHPLMAILRNPGLRPYLDGGVQRSASYDFVESYGDNWWCGNWARNFGGYGAPISPQPVAFLSTEKQQEGRKQTASLMALGSAEEFLGSQVLEYARAHPADPDIPEALYLTLRTIRYGCYHGSSSGGGEGSSSRVSDIAQEVGTLMRKNYPRDPWTKRATPYVWPAEKGEKGKCPPVSSSNSVARAAGDCVIDTAPAR